MDHTETITYQYSTQYDRDPYERQAVRAACTLLDLLGREAYKDWHASHGCIRIPYDVLYELAREAVRILLDIPAPECDCNGANRAGCPVCVTVNSDGEWVPV